MILSCIFVLLPVNAKVDYVPYENCTLVSMGVCDVNMYHKKIKMNKKDYRKIISLVKQLEEIEEIEDDEDEDIKEASDNYWLYSMLYKLDSSLVELDKLEEYRLELEKIITEKEGQPRNIRKIKIIDRFVNVRYVIHFSKFRKIRMIALGKKSTIIMVNNKFYSISRDDHKSLATYFSKKIDDPVDSLNMF